MKIATTFSYLSVFHLSVWQMKALPIYKVAVGGGGVEPIPSYKMNCSSMSASLMASIIYFCFTQVNWNVLTGISPI